MSEKLIKLAKAFVKQGYSVIPVTDRKVCMIKNWGRFQITPPTEQECEQMFANAQNIAVLTGGSGRLFCLDLDLKYDLTGNYYNLLKGIIPVAIWEKAYIQTTQNKGYHLVFKVPSTRLFGSEKLAMRPTTAYEKDATYREAFQNPQTTDNALKIALADNQRVLAESRSGSPELAQGYFLIAPSKGYTPVQGKFGELTEEEYDTLIELVRSTNQVFTDDKAHKLYSSDEWEVTPFEAYNNDTEAIIELLLSHGWTIVSESGRNVRWRRPGSNAAPTSALLDRTNGVFNCFSTSTLFECNKGYSGSSVLAILSFDGDLSATYKYLISKEYGTKKA
jgi:hypothetical protein